MTTNRMSLFICGFLLLGACAKEPAPRSVEEFAQNPILLEATVVRCSQNRSETRYDPECINAREAVSRVMAKEERERRTDLEAQSERKRQALRRTQAAAAEARRRTADTQRKREEAEYLAQFGAVPPTEEEGSSTTEGPTNAPLAVIPEAVDDTVSNPGPSGSSPASDGSNAPVVETTPPKDLDEIREELRRRGEEPGN